MRTRIVNTGVNLGLLVLSILIGLAVSEAAIRVALPADNPSGHVKLTRLPDGTPIGPRNVVLRQVKNTGDYDVTVRFNAAGLRDDKPLSAARAADLVVVGDSFAFGWGVEAADRFSDRLQAMLARPVFNIAIGGASIDDYHGLVRHAEAGGAVAARLVIAVTMENDIQVYDDAVPGTPPVAVGPMRRRLAAALDQLKVALAEHSAVYFALTRAIHGTAWLRGLAQRSGLLRPNLDGISEINGSDAALTSSTERLVQLARGREAMVLIIPSRRLWVGPAAERATAGQVHTALVARLGEAGLRVVDLRSRLEQGGAPLGYHFVNDGHWNAEGHRLAAMALAEALAEAMLPLITVPAK